MITATAENPFAGQGSVLLDIGDDIGAVLVSMPAEMEGVEVEIRPDGGHVQDPHDHGHGHPHGHAHHPHVAVVSRPVEGGRLPSLVFPEVREGTYGLYLKEGRSPQHNGLAEVNQGDPWRLWRFCLPLPGVVRFPTGRAPIAVIPPRDAAFLVRTAHRRLDSVA